MVEHLLFDSFTNIHYCIFPDLINGNLVFLMTAEILTVFNGIKKEEPLGSPFPNIIIPAARL